MIDQTCARNVSANYGLQDWEWSVIDYYTEVADAYDGLYQDKLSRDENAVVKDYLAGTGDYVIDLGCGTGLGLRLLPRPMRQRYLGVDICPKMVSKATALNRMRHSFKLGRMEVIPEESGAASDVISIFGSFSHSRVPESVIDECFRVLRPGGRLLLMAYAYHATNHFCKSYQIRNSTVVKAGQAPARFYTPAELHRLVSTRFEDVRVTGLTTLGRIAPIFGVTAIDRVIGRYLPGLAHSLIVTGVKHA